MRSVQRTANTIGIKIGLLFGTLFLVVGLAWTNFEVPSIGLLIGSAAFGTLSYAGSSLTVFLIEYRRIRQSGAWYQFWAEFNTTEDSLNAYAEALSVLKQVGLM